MSAKLPVGLVMYITDVMPITRHFSSSDRWAKDITVGNHGNYLPREAQSGWYYYAVTETDASYPLVANNLVEASQIVGMCWDDPTHNDSSTDVCGNLFSVEAGSNITSFNTDNNDTCTSNQDGGMTCVIGNHTHNCTKLSLLQSNQWSNSLLGIWRRYKLLEWMETLSVQW